MDDGEKNNLGINERHKVAEGHSRCDGRHKYQTLNDINKLLCVTITFSSPSSGGLLGASIVLQKWKVAKLNKRNELSELIWYKIWVDIIFILKIEFTKEYIFGYFENDFIICNIYLSHQLQFSWQNRFIWYKFFFTYLLCLFRTTVKNMFTLRIILVFITNFKINSN